MATISELLAQYRKHKDRIDEIAAEEAQIRDMMGIIERSIMDTMKDAGLEKATAAGVTVTRGEKWRAKYDPEKWAGIVKWCAETGRDYLIQRRLTDSRVMELVDNGTALPEGLTVESFPNLAFRRVGEASDSGK